MRLLCWVVGHEFSTVRVWNGRAMIGQPYLTLRTCWRCRKQDWEMHP